MFIRKVGPYWNTPDEGAPGAGDQGAPDAGAPKADESGKVADPGSGGDKAVDVFAALDQDTRGWLQKKGYADVSALAKGALEGEKLIGSSIRVPGKDATQEERDAFLNKLGRPEKAEGYEYTPPKELPEGLPYDGEKANAFKALSHKLGLTKDQSAALHDFYIGEQVQAFGSMGEAQKAALQQRGEQQTELIVKEFGPLDGDKFRANAEVADKLFTQLPGGQDLLAELQTAGVIGPNKEILSAALFKAFSALGTALYTEDGVLRGKSDTVGNVFDEKGPNFNLTEAMAIAKSDPDRARSLITAAGGNLKAFGLKP